MSNEYGSQCDNMHCWCAIELHHFIAIIIIYIVHFVVILLFTFIVGNKIILDVTCIVFTVIVVSNQTMFKMCQDLLVFLLVLFSYTVHLLWLMFCFFLCSASATSLDHH